MPHILRHVHDTLIRPLHRRAFLPLHTFLALVVVLVKTQWAQHLFDMVYTIIRPVQSMVFYYGWYTLNYPFSGTAPLSPNHLSVYTMYRQLKHGSLRGTVNF